MIYQSHFSIKVNTKVLKMFLTVGEVERLESDYCISSLSLLEIDREKEREILLDNRP